MHFTRNIIQWSVLVGVAAVVSMCSQNEADSNGLDNGTSGDGGPTGAADGDTDVDGDSDTDVDGDSDTDVDGDSDTDSDTDVDGDSDTDVDGDSDTDSDTDVDGDSDTDVDGDSDMTPSSGCGLAPPENGSYTIEADGLTRTYEFDVPSGYNPDTPYPIVFGFHGMGTSGEMLKARFYANLPEAMGDEAILIHPDALGDPTAWDTQRDVPYIKELFEYLKTVVCIDENRVFATGHSSGGFFTNSLGCEWGDQLRGIAPVSGGGPMVFGGNSCKGQVAAWIAHGDNDDTVEISSGEGSRDRWAEYNSCDVSASIPATPDECVTYDGCDTDYPVHWCVYHDGHNWPAFGSEAMWAFFKSLP